MLRLTAATIMLAGSTAAVAGPLPSSGYHGGRLVTAGDPNSAAYALSAAGVFNGTGVVFTPITSGPFAGLSSFCSGTVIGKRHVLTAAHCVDHQVTGQDPGDEFGQTRFRQGGRSGTIPAQQSVKSYVHPYYLNPNIGRDAFGAFALGDIAVVELPQDVVAGTTLNRLYQGDPLNRTVTHIGYGTSGSGKSGGTTFDQLGRTGLNEYEATLAPLIGSSLFSGQLLYDFDSGRKSNDAMSWWFGTGRCATSGVVCNFPNRNELYLDTGFGASEVFIDGGDSGGPGFIDGLVAGVHSFGFTSFCANAFAKQRAQGAAFNPDRDCTLNSSFGEMAGDTSVAVYFGWINDILSGGTGSAFANPLGLPASVLAGSRAPSSAMIPALNGRTLSHIAAVPEPGMIGLFGFAFAAALAARRRN